MAIPTQYYNLPAPAPSTPTNKLGAELLAFAQAIDTTLKNFDYNGADPALLAARVAALEAWRTALTAELANRRPQRQLTYSAHDSSVSGVYAPAGTWTDIPGASVSLTGVDGKLNLELTGSLFNGSSGAARSAGVRLLVNGVVIGPDNPANLLIPVGSVYDTHVAISRKEQTPTKYTGNVTVKAQWQASLAPAVGGRTRFEVTEIPA